MKIGVTADKNAKAQAAKYALSRKYDIIDLEEMGKCPDVDVILVLGGDGFMLHSLHYYISCGLPIYGMNCGTIGFLMNSYNENDLLDKINKAKKTTIHPLLMEAIDGENRTHKELAINEVSILRKTGQAAKIKISIDGKTQIEEMICDGVMVSTPAGSTAYNLSVGGPILPIKSNLLALTPISPFRPRRWRGALLPHSVNVEFKILKGHKRPANAVADYNEVENVSQVTVKEDRSHSISLLFDPGHSLEERIISEQFVF